MGGPFHTGIAQFEPLAVACVLGRDNEGRFWLRLPGLNELNLTSLYNRAYCGTDYLERWIKALYQGDKVPMPEWLGLTTLELAFMVQVLGDFAGRTADMDGAMAEALMYKINGRLQRELSKADARGAGQVDA